MKRKLMSIILAAALLAAMLVVPASATGAGGTNTAATHWFYNQLTAQGKKIYDAMVQWYRAGGMRDGTSSLDLVAKGAVNAQTVDGYLNGNRTLFNDFAAAKDAFDLEHPEAWYVDSSYLSFRVTREDNGAYHAYIGPGRGENYYVQGAAAETVADMSDAVESIVLQIANGARQYSSTADQVRYVHKQITERISYRFENECTPGNEGYVRTIYALVTHEGVCESYARALQYVLNDKLGIPCVLIHGVQSSGVPEEHMWTAVKLGNEWYVVDPTWDDPVPLDKNGHIKVGVNGLDGGETETYLLVGQDVVGKNWNPSGYVSTGTMEFTYPTIALRSYGVTADFDQNGLTVLSSEVTSERVPATRYEVSFNGMGVKKSADAGYYFLVKMYDLNADGSMTVFDDWYYSAHGLHVIGTSFDPDNDFKNTGNPDYYDTDEAMIMVVSQCEYVEFAVTTTPPPKWESAWDLYTMGGYYSGGGADIVAQSGLIYNSNGGYEAPPYIKNASPLFNVPLAVGQTYTMHLEFTDPLYKPTQADLDKAIAGKEGDLRKVIGQSVTMDYVGTNYSWGVNGNLPHTFASKPTPTNITWICSAPGHSTHSGIDNITTDCRLTALEYQFTPSSMWADDSVQYEFSLTGLVGVLSNKTPNVWSYVFENTSAYCAYRCYTKGGIGWNLWGQPQLLDNPADLDLSKMVTQGVTGEDAGNLAALREQMHLDSTDMNGRIMLVVEDLSGSRASSEELSAALSDTTNGVSVPADAIASSSMYEIDFARICRKTIVETGQSLRLSVGFPPGFDASMEGIVFKAYHFVRDIEGSCDITTPGHVHTGLVTKVEEIPITVTQYGLVILCNSFSPFEIVAIDTSKTTGITDTSLKNTVTLVNDGHGKVTVPAASQVTRSGGEKIANMAQINSGSVTFTVTPDDGYKLDTVSFSGARDIVVGADNTFTLTYSDVKDANAILSVTFIPETVDEAQAGEVVTPKVCTHEHITGTDYLAPTCTAAGHTDGKTCADCGQVLSVSAVLPATGHTFENGVCTVCGEKDGQDTPPAETPDVTFTDVQEGAYYYDAVLWAVKNEVTKGTGDGMFSPDSSCTRAQIVTFLWRANGRPAPKSTSNPFTDVTRERHPDYYDAILWAVEEGITKGTGDGMFSPDEPCTRAQIVTFLWRANNKPAPKTTENRFADVTREKYPDYYDAILWAVENGITKGADVTGTLFIPNDTCTRGQCVTFLYRDMVGEA